MPGPYICKHCGKEMGSRVGARSVSKPLGGRPMTPESLVVGLYRYPYLKNKFLSSLLWWMLWLVSMAPSAAGAVYTNDNMRPAGRLEGDVLNIRLYAGVGSWRPEGPQGAPIEIAAFGEEGADLSIPGPLIRVREGTTVVLTLRNALGSALFLADRPEEAMTDLTAVINELPESEREQGLRLRRRAGRPSSGTCGSG